jgi:putative SbcD/Mre11-related phosphoesterase
VKIEDLFVIPKGKKALIYNKTLIIADVHLGYESEAEEDGAYLPRAQLKHALSEIKEIVDQYSLERIIIAGDLKHKFEALTWQERVEIEKFINTIKEYGIHDIILVRGNHDTFIKRLMDNLNVKMIDGLLELDDHIGVVHGHISPSTNELKRYKYIIMGHEHPVVVIKLGGMTATRFPVFLSLPLNCCETRAIILPAFGIYQSGNPISLNKESYLSPIIRRYGVPEKAKLYISDSGMTLEMPEMQYIKEYIIA